MGREEGRQGPALGTGTKRRSKFLPLGRRAAKWDRAYGWVGRCVATDHHGGLDGDVTDAFSPHQWGR